MEHLRSNQALSEILKAISAAVVGVILNLGVWFALHTLFALQTPFVLGPMHLDVPVLPSLNVWSLVLSAAAVLALFRFKANMVVTLAGCSAAGVVLYLT